MQDKAQQCCCGSHPERKYVGYKVEVTDNGVVNKNGLVCHKYFRWWLQERDPWFEIVTRVKHHVHEQLTSAVGKEDAMSVEQCAGSWSTYRWQNPEPPTYFRNQFWWYSYDWYHGQSRRIEPFWLLAVFIMHSIHISDCLCRHTLHLIELYTHRHPLLSQPKQLT